MLRCGVVWSVDSDSVDLQDVNRSVVREDVVKSPQGRIQDVAVTKIVFAFLVGIVDEVRIDLVNR